MNTNQIGNVTEMQCIMELMKFGCQISLPFGGQSRYDFLADINNEILKIQVKTCVVKDDGNYIKIEGRNSCYIKGQCVHSSYTKDEIDLFATFYNGICYLIPVEECISGKVLRFSEPKNGQIKNINFAKDYEAEKVLKKYFNNF